MREAEPALVTNERTKQAFGLGGAVLAVSCGLGASGTASAADRYPLPEERAEADVAQLEAAFWQCDYAATVAGMQAVPIHHCALVTQALKAAKFSGDFEALLRWWRANKPFEHARLARSATTGGGAPTRQD